MIESGLAMTSASTTRNYGHIPSGPVVPKIGVCLPNVQYANIHTEQRCFIT